MKKTTIRITIALLILAVLATSLLGCKNNDDNDFVKPDYLFLPDVTQLRLPEGVEWIKHITVGNDKIYFAASPSEDELSKLQSDVIYEVDFYGTNLKVFPDYDALLNIPDDVISSHEDTNGYVAIYSLHVDGDGNVWVTEFGEFFFFDLPDDFDGDDWDRWEYRKVIYDFTRVRKLDNTGSELLSIDITHISSGYDWFYIQSMAVDSDGNAYIGIETTVYVINNEGKTLFTLDTGYVESFVVMQDGSVAHIEWRDRGRAVVKIDVNGSKWGEVIDIPDNFHRIFAGNDEYMLIVSDSTGLYGIEASTGDHILLLNWIDSDMSSEGLGNVTLLSSEQILTVNRHWGSSGERHEIIMLTKTPYSEISERQILTLATFHLDWEIRNVIVQFNRNSTTHRIVVTDYATFNTDDDWQAGLMRLSTEIVSGKVPDILDVSSLPFNQYAARGLLVDLYSFIDSDPDFDRSDFMESALKATEFNGGLYKLFPSFNIITIAGNPSIVGDYPGWTMDEFLAVLAANPGADVPLGLGLTKESFLQALVMFHMDKYVDWVTGDVSFDSDDFISLLEFANTLPADDYDWNDEYIPTHKLLSSGRQLMMPTSFYEINEYQINRAMLGGDLVYKGFPTENRNGNTLVTHTGFAISEKCVDKDAAWNFIRTFLSDEWQSDNFRNYYLPIIKDVFDERLKDAMSENEWGSSIYGIDGLEVEIEPLTQAEADQIMALINSVTGSVSQDETIWNIISESATSYFSGQTSAQDAARVIQNRISTYVAEQG
ncbi:MAG: extracellular solute-binding protein [Oscillospiraceae bacterium]|jgi:ABC-type glycerol-3-phosphate transport system substrate-binding protein|nr:extracellular solute-binding protein [Oscillospiraceae bacterium]